MELRDYLRVARRRWVLIVGTLATVVALAAIITFQLPKQYASTARVFISTTSDSSRDAFQSGQFSEQRIASYADVVTGLDISQRVIEELDLDISPDELSDSISATAVPSTVVLRITVTQPSAARAQRINEALVTQLQTLVAELETPPGGRTPVLKATVVDAPRLEAEPVSPSPVRNIGAAVALGLILGFALAVVREILDTSVKRIEDVPSLSSVPLLSALSYDADVRKNPLISSLPGHAPRAEAFRVLRTNLQFVDVDQASKVFNVTSSMPGEGKSTTAVNVAIAMATADQRVVLVDGDLRRPQVAGLLGLESAVGVTSVLVGSTTLDAAIQTHAASGLDVLTAGRIPPNPSELLQSQAMRELLDELRSRFDVVVIDSPPLLPVTDASVIAAQVDGALLVVRFGRTTKDQLRNAVDRLHSVDSAPLGIVMNMISSSSGRPASGYGYGYGYGYAPTAKVEK